MLRVAEYLPLLHRMLDDYGLPGTTLEIVPNVQAWSWAQGIVDSNPFRTAKCLCRASDGACHIVMAEEISEDQIRGGKSGMECQGFKEEVRTLASDRDYLVHLMLHEIACHVLKTTEQRPRDEWAFAEMSKYAG